MEIGYIYVMKMDSFYKIGKTKDKKRFGEYTRLPIEPEYLIVSKVYDYHNLEKQLHTIYKSKKTRDNCEWYVLSDNDIDEIRQFIKKYEIIDDKNPFYMVNFDFKNGISVSEIDYNLSICKRKLYTDEYHCINCGGNDLYLKMRTNKNGADHLVCKKCNKFVGYANENIKKYYTPEYCGGYKYNKGEIEIYSFYTIKNTRKNFYNYIHFEDSEINTVREYKSNNKQEDRLYDRYYVGYGNNIEKMLLNIVNHISVKIDESYNIISDCRKNIGVMNNFNKDIFEYIGNY